MTALNTPLPWKLQDLGDCMDVSPVDKGGWFLRLSHQVPPAEMTEEIRDEFEANCTFILKAVNEYASLKSRADAVPMLVDALKQAKEAMAGIIDSDDPPSDLSMHLIRQAVGSLNVAIAQVTPLLANPSGLPSTTPSSDDIRATDSASTERGDK